jgi:hypothetical protein
MKTKLFLVLFLVFGILNASIIEMKHMREVSKYVDKNTLLIFDLDNTLIELPQHLGSEEWFYNTFQDYKKKKMSEEEALQNTLLKFFAVQHLSQVRIVEENSDKIIQDLQKKNFSIIGLTTRHMELSLCTAFQLESLNINLLKTSPSDKEVFFNNPRSVLFKNGLGSVLFKNGILFTSGTDKGKALFTLLEKINYHPKKIVFVNDKLSHLKEVEIACENNKISFVGVRYSFLDDKINIPKREISDLQFKHFNDSILTDHEAELMFNLTNK